MITTPTAEEAPIEKDTNNYREDPFQLSRRINMVFHSKMDIENQITRHSKEIFRGRINKKQTKQNQRVRENKVQLILEETSNTRNILISKILK